MRNPAFSVAISRHVELTLVHAVRPTKFLEYQADRSRLIFTSSNRRRTINTLLYGNFSTENGTFQILFTPSPVEELAMVVSIGSLSLRLSASVTAGVRGRWQRVNVKSGNLAWLLISYSPLQNGKPAVRCAVVVTVQPYVASQPARRQFANMLPVLDEIRSTGRHAMSLIGNHVLERF